MLPVKIQTLTVIKGGEAVGCEQEWILLGHFLSVLGYFWNELRKAHFSHNSSLSRHGLLLK